MKALFVFHVAAISVGVVFCLLAENLLASVWALAALAQCITAYRATTPNAGERG